MDTVSCNPGECERAKGHYKRVNEAVYDMLIHEHKMSRDMIEKYAEKHQVVRLKWRWTPPFCRCRDL